MDNSIVLISMCISEIALSLFHITTSSTLLLDSDRKSSEAGETRESYETTVHQNLKMGKQMESGFVCLSSSYE